MRSRIPTPQIFIISIFILSILLILSILYGPVYIDPLRILRDMLGQHSLSESEKVIIYSRRIPASLGALASGALLGISGLLYQILLRNPVGDPYILGVASISYTSLVAFAYISISLGFFFYYMSLIAPIFVLIVALIYTFILSILSLRLSILQLLIVGVSIGFASSGASLIILSRLPPDVAGYLSLALMGSFEPVDLRAAETLLGSLIVILIFTLMLSIKHLDPLILGDDYARSLGVNVNIIRLLISLISGCSAAITVAYVGVIGFIGFASPHIARILTGSGKSIIIAPLTGIIGGSIALLTGLIAKTLFQGAPLTAITSLFGAPLLIYMVSRMRGEYSW